MAEADHAAHTSRITIVSSRAPDVIEQIEAQLTRIVPVHRVTNRTNAAPGVERGVDTTQTSFIFEIMGAPEKLDNFIGIMRPLGLVDVSRTGVASISRGPEAM